MTWANDYAARVLRPIDEAIAAAVEKTANGTPQTWDEYRQLVGLIRGLRQAREEVIRPLGPSPNPPPGF